MFERVAYTIVFVFYAVCGFAADPQVGNIRASQLDNSFTVEILYDLIDPDPNALTVSVEVSDDDGSTFLIHPQSLTGDVGENILPGTDKAIYWDAGTDLPGVFGDNYRAKVIVSEEFANPGNGTVDISQYQWRLASTTGPGPRRRTRMVYHDHLRKVILFGGVATSLNEPLNDTWSWNGVRWTEETGQDPPSRFWNGMVYDADVRQVFVLGGNSVDPNFDFVTLDDLWFWDGRQWAESPITRPERSPSARSLPLMAYDSGRKQIVMHGGLDQFTSPLSDTWEFNVDNLRWTRVLGDGPEMIGNTNMVYHPIAQRVVFLQKEGTGFVVHTYDGASWSNVILPPAILPNGDRLESLWYHRLVYFPPTQSILVHGGNTLTTPSNQEERSNWLWELTDLNRLTPLRSDGPRVSSHEIVYDAERNQIVLHGGFINTSTTGPSSKANNETWVFGQ